MKSLFVLVVLLLFQSITSVPLEEDILTEHEKLVVIAIDELSKESNLTVKRFRDLFDRTVKDIEGQSPVSESLQKRLQEFKDFNGRVDNLPKTSQDKFLDEVFDLLKRVFELVSAYLYSKTKDNDIHFITAKLEINGLDDVLYTSMLETNVFDKRAQKRFTEWKALPESERKLDSNAVEWYKRYKAAEVKNKEVYLYLEFLKFD